MKRNTLYLVCLSTVLLLALAACAPTGSTEAVEVQQLSGAVSYYPQEAGATWQYLPTGSNISDPKVTQVIEGPTVLDGDLWVVSRLQGLGIDNRWFRKYGPDGVTLLKEQRPGQEVSYDPPLQEFPPPNTLRVGTTWGGDTVATVFYPSAKGEERLQTYPVEYRYTVVDSRPVNLQAGNFDVFVIDFEARFLGEDRNVVTTQTLTTWFTPFIGEVKTENDFFLVATNTAGR